ncbi:MAG: hypothetical protein H6Q12_610 [Bacteroidetes bacterium]|nr:hypothetical protein [Bacteroidota bacterium]
MKATIIIIVVAAVGYAAYKWFSRKPKASKGGSGGTDTPENDNPDSVKPSK